MADIGLDDSLEFFFVLYPSFPQLDCFCAYDANSNNHKIRFLYLIIIYHFLQGLLNAQQIFIYNRLELI